MVLYLINQFRALMTSHHMSCCAWFVPPPWPCCLLLEPITPLAKKLPLRHLSNLCHTRSHPFLWEYSNNLSTSSNASYTSNSPKNPIHPIWLNTVCTINDVDFRNLHLRIYLRDIDYEIASGITRDVVPLNTQQSRKVIDPSVTLILSKLMMILRFQPINFTI